ncbi:hypothetical protein Plhal304r1_c024g0082521 [Plasmopara halstedii]
MMLPPTCPLELSIRSADAFSSDRAHPQCLQEYRCLTRSSLRWLIPISNSRLACASCLR